MYKTDREKTEALKIAARAYLDALDAHYARPTSDTRARLDIIGMALDTVRNTPAMPEAVDTTAHLSSARAAFYDRWPDEEL